MQLKGTRASIVFYSRRVLFQWAFRITRAVRHRLLSGLFVDLYRRLRNLLRQCQRQRRPLRPATYTLRRKTAEEKIASDIPSK